MGTGMNGTPNDYNFGHEFDYSLWVPGTQVDLVNVSWNNDYRDAVRFDNRAALNTYIDSLEPLGIRINNLSYVKPYEPIRVDIPHTRATRYNYLRATNPLQPIPGDQQKAYYYFILDARYIAPNTTELVLQLDVWTTYIYDITLGNCYVERGHIGIANSKQFENYGRNYLSIPEGLDVGSDYVKRAEIFKSGQNNNNIVVALSTVDLEVSGGTVDNPILRTAKGSTIDGITSGASYYAWNSPGSFKTWLNNNAERPWITQGILAVMVIPRLDDFYNLPSWPTPASTPTILNNITGVGELISTMGGSSSLGMSWRDSSIFNYIPARYRHLKKLWTSPYLVLELTTFSGNPILIKPENWLSENADIVEQMSMLLPNAKHVIYPRNYNATSGATGTTDNGEGLDYTTSFPEFVKTAIVNNGAIAYLSANTNSIAFQRESADWAQQRALGSAQASYDISSGAMNTANEMANISIQADRAQTDNTNRHQMAQSIVSAVGGTAGGAAGGAAFGPVGAGIGSATGGIQGLTSIANTAIQAHSNDAANAIRATATRRSTSAQVGQMGLARDTNKGLQDWAAKGDYANAIAGINAKVQDAQMIQPSVSGQAGGAQFNLATGNWNIILRIKSIDTAYISMVGEYWLRYGYSVHRFIRPPQNLKVMERFTYWKMLETYISGSNVPEAHKQTIRGILEKGVTLWANPADIGVIDIGNNAPLGGISY